MSRDRHRRELDRLVDDAFDLTYARRAVAACVELAAEVEWLTLRAVRHARESGLSWDRIGRQFGLTRQGARKRFGPTVPQRPPTSRRPNPAAEEARYYAQLVADARRGGRPKPVDSRLTWEEFDRLDDGDIVAW